MNAKNIHIDLLNTHISEYGIEGLLPQKLSTTLLKLISIEFDNLQGKKDKSATIILNTVLLLAKGDLYSGDNKNIDVEAEEFIDQVSNYGLAITIEEIRRAGLIDISIDNLPTLGDILDPNRDLIFTGNQRKINGFMKDFKK